MDQSTKLGPTTTKVSHRQSFMHQEESNQSYLLFHQAFVEGSAAAWEAIYAQFLPAALNWARRHPTFKISGEDAHYFANRAFEKMWHSITPAKFANFPNLRSVLKYLKLCVHSVLIDHLRATKQHLLELDEMLEENEVTNVSAAQQDVAQQVDDARERSEFWAHVQARLKNEKEVQLLYYRYVLNIKPNQICQQYADTFSDLDEVYLMTQNILARLRRDRNLQAYMR